MVSDKCKRGVDLQLQPAELGLQFTVVKAMIGQVKSTDLELAVDVEVRGVGNQRVQPMVDPLPHLIDLLLRLEDDRHRKLAFESDPLLVWHHRFGLLQPLNRFGQTALPPQAIAQSFDRQRVVRMQFACLLVLFQRFVHTVPAAAESERGRAGSPVR